MRTFAILSCALLTWAAAAGPAIPQADSFPSRPITIVVPFTPGGSSDVVTRLVAQKLGDNLKTNILNTSNWGRMTFDKTDYLGTGP